MTETRTHPHDHAVAFYDTDADLVARVVDFIGDGLAGEDVAIVIASAPHRASIEAMLAERGLDSVALAAAGRYVPLDARETLVTFFADGVADPAKFREVVGTVVHDAAQRGNVLAFGEMVALLWAQGDVAAAIDLESMWNDLSEDERFVLLCAYPLKSVISRDDIDALTAVCTSHSDVAGPASYERIASSTKPRDEASCTFVPVISAVTAARSFTESTLGEWGLADLAADATIVVSELASNAVMHAESAFRLTIERTEGVVRIAVDDIDATAPVSPQRAIDTIGGLGLVLVDGLTSRWGVEPLTAGKRLWCEFALS
jgi:anti-sigma regulatory factor (Ser/Thr protein kinase)